MPPVEISPGNGDGSRPPDTIPRLGPGAYFAVAFDLLAERGPAALTIAELCKRLSVTKGSFYHHFESLPQFIEAFLHDWESTFVDLFDEIARSNDPIRRVELTIAVALDLHHAGEAALRAWGFSDPVVGAAVAQQDRQRVETFIKTVNLLIPDLDHCRLIADMSQALVVGAQMGQRPMDEENLVKIVIEAARSLVGLECTITFEDSVPVVRLTRLS